MKPIAGTTEKCLDHLAKAIEGRDFLENLKIIAAFAGVGEGAVRRWFKTGRMPVGEQLVRMRFYLQFNGYEVSELDDLLNEDVRHAAQLYAFGVASLSEIADLLNYVGKSGADSLLRVFRGARSASPEKIEHFRSFVELYEKQLDGRMRATVKVLVGTSDNRRAEETITVRSRLRTIGESHSTLIEALAASVKAMLPLAEYALSDSFSAEERQCVRKLAGGDGVSRLSLLLTKLSGEAARSALANSSKKEAAQ